MSAAAGSVAPDVDALAAAVLGVPGVAGLSAGPLGQFRTYLRGRSVAGIRVDEHRVRVQVVVGADRAFAEVARDVGSALTALAGGRRISVDVHDVRIGDSPTVESHGERG